MIALPAIDTDVFIDIDHIQEPTIHEYFKRLNDEQFMAVTELFTEQGCLHPPFEKMIQGREAIAHYLKKCKCQLVDRTERSARNYDGRSKIISYSP